MLSILELSSGVALELVRMATVTVATIFNVPSVASREVVFSMFIDTFLVLSVQTFVVRVLGSLVKACVYPATATSFVVHR